jgi:hypothetical protein
MPNTHFSNLNLKFTTVAGRNGAGTVTVAGVEVGDKLLAVLAIPIATGVMAEDITASCSVTAANTITSADASDYSTGHFLFIVYLDKNAT